MPPLSLNQAARATHQSKAAILEAILAGHLCARRDHLNQWQIEPEDLFRVYPQPHQPAGDWLDEEPTEAVQEGRQTALFFLTLRHLSAQLAAQARVAERERRLLEATISDLRADRDHWRAQATKHPRPLPTPAAPLAREPGRAASSGRGRGWRLLFWVAITTALGLAALLHRVTAPAIPWP